LVRLRICKISYRLAEEMESLLDDGDQNIGGDGDPDLRLNAILGSPVEGFDPQMLLDPFEKELRLASGSRYSSVIVNAGRRNC